MVHYLRDLSSIMHSWAYEHLWYIFSNKRNCARQKMVYFFQPWQIAHWNKLSMKVHLIFQMVSQTWNLWKAFFVFWEVAENWLVRVEVIKSVSPVSSSCIDHCWAYSPHGTNCTCVKVLKDDIPGLHKIFNKLLPICWLHKAADADDKISTPSHPTYVQHFRPGENDFQQWVELVETCDFFIGDGTDTE